MIKYKLFTVLVCLCMLCTTGIAGGEGNAPESTGLVSPYDNVIKVDVNADGPSYIEHQKYDYSTSLRNEIAYILNYINNFHLEDDGRVLYANDASSYSVEIYMIDGSMKKCGFSIGRFDDNSGKQYAIDRNEYNGFLDFIHALKAEKIVLDDEVTFEPSEWAKSDVEKAVTNGLVPGLNQINYSGKINRLEVCRLVDNLLEKQSIAQPKSTENPFSDTTDESVTRLYSHSIIEGKSEREFYPYDYITREEFAKILSKTYHFLENGLDLVKHDTMYSDDAEISAWAKEYIYEMTSLGVLNGKDNGIFDPRDEITKEEVIISLLRLTGITN